MKKYIISLLFIFSVLLSHAAPLDYAHILIYDDVEKYFLDKFVSGKETTYTICIEEYSNGKQLKEETAKEIFLDSLDNWLDTTKYYISETNREEEFKDISQILDNKKNLKQIPCSFSEDGEIRLDSDLTIVYKLDASEYCGNAVACFLVLPSTLVVSTVSNTNIKNYKKYVTHEIGHAFGLADQYSGAMYDGSFLYNSKVKRPSIMDDNRKVTCDDVDGFITSIDRILGKEREFYSLCSDGLFIKNGQAVIPEIETYNLKENYEHFDADIVISYDTEFENAYILDMTLKNFILNQEGLNLIQDMGFDVNDLKTLKHSQVKIHGTALEVITEENDDTLYIRTPIGLWTAVLYKKKGFQSEPKQVITKEYFSLEDLPTITYLDTNSSALIFSDIKIPLINFLSNTGSGEKEKLRRKAFLGLLNLDLEMKSKQLDKYQNLL